MEIIEVTSKTIPEIIIQQLQGLPIEKQLDFFYLQKCDAMGYYTNSKLNILKTIKESL